ncbi:uncharacterized protein LAESUDRAFT_651046 [Laetiporus sulphureus 93-53]|uniref:Uncharacterized protein n=1 Tax=Laetiporus sulphureus 93-53 TaxID=1314785 RepID=A0A165ERQ5_9APHY|nr:uncharacterized protein LAESUDRAFT_651046 [Laetiporus sulphureus 93-53]KZT07629.1 hypothetical protein LAESUDRAFT_651046 [Laetiporus sulphureus 93-53]
MAPKNKAKAAGVSASSFFDLKAELLKKEEEFAKNKAAGKPTTLVGGVKRADKKPTIWARQNQGVKARAARDIELEEISKPTIDSALAALERKAQIYEKLRKGRSGGISEKQYESLLVDFDSKAMDAYESDSDDVDESLTVPRRPAEEEDDPIIEYEDEFGRIRSGRRSEVPRHLLPQMETTKQGEDIEYVHCLIFRYNPVNYFPVYEPSAERVAAIEAEYAEENNPLNVHYDAAQEVRAKGAGFYQFSGDEETRKRQMEELRRAREETEKTREEIGAADVRPGEMDGMRAPGEEGSGPIKSRAMEKRKRELEERRKMVDAKRRKLAGTRTSAPAEGASPGPVPAIPSPAPMSPFAALEAKSSSKGKQKAEVKETPMNAADAFLAQLEQEVLKNARP